MAKQDLAHAALTQRHPCRLAGGGAGLTALGAHLASSGLALSGGSPSLWVLEVLVNPTCSLQPTLLLSPPDIQLST